MPSQEASASQLMSSPASFSASAPPSISPSGLLQLCWASQSYVFAAGPSRPSAFVPAAHSPLSLLFFFLIFHVSVQRSIILETSSPCPEIDSALTPLTWHNCVHISHLPMCVHSKQPISTLCQGLDRGWRHRDDSNVTLSICSPRLTHQNTSFCLIICLTKYVTWPLCHQPLETVSKNINKT